MMGPGQLAELRQFLAGVEPQLPQAVAVMFNRLLETIPEARQLFKGDLQHQQERYLHMLREIVKLTRSCHLWPVQALSGTSSIPAIDSLGSRHSRLGVTRDHFDKMRTVLVQCFKLHCQERFTPAAEEALGFIFDVVSRASTSTSKATQEDVARKNKLPHLFKTMEPGTFAGFFGGEAQEEAP
jgi:hemoglobin-like flavoprotein